MNMKRFKLQHLPVSVCYTLIAALAFALFLAVMLLVFPKEYRTYYLEGTYESNTHLVRLTFLDEGRYCLYTTEELYESGTYAETERPGIFRLSPYGPAEEREVLVFQDGRLYWAEGNMLHTYELISNSSVIYSTWAREDAFPDMNILPQS